MQRATVMLCVAASVGCTFLNPAFDASQETEASASSETALPESGEADVGDGDPTTGDGDPTTGDGDPTTGDGDGDPGTGDGDGDPPVCEFDMRNSISFQVVNPDLSCPPQDNFFAPIFWDQVGGPYISDVLKCGPGCDGCGEPVSFGVPNYDLLDGLLTSISPGNNLEGCVQVQVQSLYLEDETGCHYASASITDLSLNLSTFFILDRNQAPLTPRAMEVFTGTEPPSPGDARALCDCATIWNGKQTEVDCCESADMMPSEFGFNFVNQTFAPGPDTPVHINNVQWTFHPIQAQQIPGCVTGDGIESAWTLLKYP